MLTYMLETDHNEKVGYHLLTEDEMVMIKVSDNDLGTTVDIHCTLSELREFQMLINDAIQQLNNAIAPLEG